MLRQSASEKKHLELIITAMMPITDALSYVQGLDFNLPYANRLTFVKAIAALVALYRTVAPGPRTIREVLHNVSARECRVQTEPHTVAAQGRDEPAGGYLQWYSLH